MTLKNLLIVFVLIFAAVCLLYAVISDLQEMSVRRSGLSFFDWFTPALLGIAFTALGIIKFIGQKRGIVGGGGKSLKVRLTSGYCPTWSRPVNLAAPYVILGIGLFHFGILVWYLLKS